MTNEELIERLLDFPLDSEAEPCRPIVTAGQVRFRAGCDQSTCPKLEALKGEKQQDSAIIKMILDELVDLGQSKDTPEGVKVNLRKWYQLITKAGYRTWKSQTS